MSIKKYKYVHVPELTVLWKFHYKNRVASDIRQAKYPLNIWSFLYQVSGRSIDKIVDIVSNVNYIV